MITKKDESLGKQIKKQRKKVGFTQDQLAEKSGLSTKYIQFVESANRTPSLKTLYKIAKALGVKVKDLFHF
jgi:transcriptional regulator with XRE-family HTH domain